MKLAVLGAGATGGYVAALLARSGADVTVLARGKTLDLIQTDGIEVRDADGEWRARPAATDDWSVLGGVETVLLTVKANAISELAPRLGAALGPRTSVVTAQNGIPWWYFQGFDGPLAGTRLKALDPSGEIARALPLERIIGCVVWPATRRLAPNVVEHIEGHRFTLGEPTGEKSERCTALASVLSTASLKCRVNRRIRQEIWTKLLGNLVMNPLSALTRATLRTIGTDPLTRSLAAAMMGEAASIAAALGAAPEVTIKQRLDGAVAVGEHKSSMLQDLEAGLPMEVDAMLGSVIEIADLLGIPTPHLRSVYACVSLLNRENCRG